MGERCVDVVIIGNGPAGVCLSLMLSGYLPYFNGQHADSLLKAKCSEGEGKPLVDQDLQYLSEGLEGRSRNPVALLFDALMHPDTDLGEDLPSSLYWARDASRAVPHVVVGSGHPGGCWQKMGSHVKSLSPVRWLELPIYGFSAWLSERERPSLERPHLEGVCLSHVGQYYRDYVAKMGLTENFLNHTIVRNVEQVAAPSNRSGSRRLPKDYSGKTACNGHVITPHGDGTSDDNRFIFPYLDSFLRDHFVWGSLTVDEIILEKIIDAEMNSSDLSAAVQPDSLLHQDGYRWHLRAEGAEGSNTTGLYCKRLVLACGTDSSPRWLGVEGEHFPFIAHTFSDFCCKVQPLPPQSTVMVVGAGLSAADAVNLAMSKGLHVVHVYHQDTSSPSLVYQKLPPLYTHYKNVLDLMNGKIKSSLYTPVIRSIVTEFKMDGTSTIITNHGERHMGYVVASAVGVLIGSNADLDFLPRHIQTELGLDSKPFNSKTNPVIVNPYTYEWPLVPNLYAIGSLMGDTLVRFILGGALAVTRDIMQSLNRAGPTSEIVEGKEMFDTELGQDINSLSLNQPEVVVACL